jgi:hypothetical protein
MFECTNARTYEPANSNRNAAYSQHERPRRRHRYMITMMAQVYDHGDRVDARPWRRRRYATITAAQMPRSRPTRRRTTTADAKMNLGGTSSLESVSHFRKRGPLQFVEKWHTLPEKWLAVPQEVVWPVSPLPGPLGTIHVHFQKRAHLIAGADTRPDATQTQAFTLAYTLTRRRIR